VPPSKTYRKVKAGFWVLGLSERVLFARETTPGLSSMGEGRRGADWRSRTPCLLAAARRRGAGDMLPPDLRKSNRGLSATGF